MKNIVLLVIICCNAFSFYGQTKRTEIHKSPYTVIYNHLYYLQDENYNAEQAALSLPKDTPDRIKTAIRLQKILNGKGIYIDFNKLPTDHNYIDSTLNKAVYFLKPLEQRLYVEKINSKWYYSHTTIDEIPSLYEEVFKFDINIEDYFNAPIWNIRIAGLIIAGWLGLLILIIVTIIIYKIAEILTNHFVLRSLNRKYDLNKSVIHNIKKCGHLFALFVALHTFHNLLPLLELPTLWNAIFLRIVNVASIILMVLLINRIIDFIVVHLDKIALKTSQIIDNEVLPIFSRIIKTIIWIIGIMLILQQFNVNMIAILTSLSIGGLALALAAQDTVKNLIGSALIFIDKPFRLGDWIQFEDTEGIVEEIGVRSTRIRTFENSLLYVPNANLVNDKVNNMGLRGSRRFKDSLGITYNTKTADIDAFVEGIKKIISDYPDTNKTKYNAYLDSLQESAINIGFYCFLKVNDSESEQKAKHEILTKIIVLAEKSGINFAYPTRSIFLETEAIQTPFKKAEKE